MYSRGIQSIQLVIRSVLFAIAVPVCLAGATLAEGLVKKTDQCELCEYSEPVFWVVNSRCSPRCSDLDFGFEQLTYQRWSPCDRRFVNETRESFLAAQANIPTLMFIHGNSLDHQAALESVWTVYNRIKVCPGPKLLVMWSWPAEIVYKKPLLRPIHLARKNIRVKYAYAERQGYYVAKLANMMSTAHPLTLGGHSYGAAVSVVAAHYLGGGSLNGWEMEGGSPDERANLRLSLISPALDNDHLYPGHRYDQAMYPIELMHTTFSDEDATLKRWPTHSCRGQQAMGYTGVCASRLGDNAHKLCQQRLTEDVGRSHYMKPHLASVKMISAVCRTAFNTSPTVGSNGNSKGSRLRAPSVDLQDVIQTPATMVFPGLAL